MDCKTAQLLLDFARPQARELEAEEATALENHLDRCPDCHSQARSERQLDDCLGKAMRQVEVPAGLRDQLLAKLESERGDWYRQRFAHGARLAVAAAAALLLAWGVWYWVKDRFAAPIDPGQVVDAVKLEASEDPRTRTEAALRRMGVDSALSQSLDYHFLAYPPVKAELPGYPGRMVPMLIFEGSGRKARVYLIRDKEIPDNTLNAIDRGTFKAELLPSEGEPYRFLVIHDGEDLKWLRLPPPNAA
jgi:hypothetical protein